jgi:hypothetical protein
MFECEKNSFTVLSLSGERKKNKKDKNIKSEISD